MNNEQEIIWVTLPNGDPGVLISYYDYLGQPTKNPQEAMHVIAADRFERFLQFEIRENTFNKLRMQ